MNKLKDRVGQVKKHLLFICKWMIICLLIGIMAGSASAFFLHSLDWVEQFRNNHQWIYFLLPAGGLIVGLSYHYWGSEVVAGNNLIINEYHRPQKPIPFIMAPLVLAGTLVTHLVGGSAGREGTAVQMAGALADRITQWFKLNNDDRKIILCIGVSAGFASVFGTPLAGTVFALEVMLIGRMRYEALLPSLLGAIAADHVCMLWHAHHTHYSISEVPAASMDLLLWALAAGVVFGLAALVFTAMGDFWGGIFKKYIAYPPLRPVVGGFLLAAVFLLTGAFRYAGLGVPVIVEAFEQQVPWYDFMAKTIFTTFTLGSGFKGGEVTPLFYVGATLGNTLSTFIPLPMALLAGMGFVAVFSGTTNTPIACTIMGMELFGVPCGVFVALACFTAYVCSGPKGIYAAQPTGSPKLPKKSVIANLTIQIYQAKKTK